MEEEIDWTMYQNKIHDIAKLEDANFAGGSRAKDCTLILTEGDSAKAFVMAGLAITGRDTFGVFPLKGKLLNVRSASSKQITNNGEIVNIMKILGLNFGAKYTCKTALRYGRLLIMADQDPDGNHFTGLIINFLYFFWPEILQIPKFVFVFNTPLIKAFHVDQSSKFSFYSMDEYNLWRKGSDASSWSIKYYKGLGTNTSKEGRKYFRHLEDKHCREFCWKDDGDGGAIEKAFSKARSNDRKQWILEYKPDIICRNHVINYKDFVDKFLIQYAIADLRRSIPSMVDGLKSGQRKVLFCTFLKKWTKEVTVGSLSGYVSEHSDYNHGDENIISTIIGMAQNHMGSNNINLLKPNGQFGTRNLGGNDQADPRYIYTELNPLTRCLFPESDDNNLNYLNEDGRSIVPQWYLPIIPMILVNGCEGVATGWSTSIPNYNPRDIVANVKRMLKKERMVPMVPWYRGFNGRVEKTEEEGIYESKGDLEILDKRTFRVKELPIGMWTQTFKEFLESKTNGPDPLIEDFIQKGDDTTIDIVIRMKDNKTDLMEEKTLLGIFNLRRKINTKNMHLFDSNGKIKKYETPEDVIADHYAVRLQGYKDRNKSKRDKLLKRKEMLLCKMQFISLILEGELVIFDRTDEDLVKELKRRGFKSFPKEGTEPQVAGATDNSLEEKEAGAENEAEWDGYGYLLSMPVGTIKMDTVQKMKEETKKITAMIDASSKKESIISMWINELDQFLNKLDEIERKDNQEEESSIEALSSSGSDGSDDASPPQNKVRKIRGDSPFNKKSGSGSATNSHLNFEEEVVRIAPPPTEESEEIQ